MGYGGIIKTVFRVAASVVGGMVCGPPCAAIGSAVATGATGGSFKEALMAGATSYIGASISANVSGAIGDAAASSAASVNSLPTTFINADALGNAVVQNVSAGGIIPAGFADAGSALTGALTQVPGSLLAETAQSFIDPTTEINQGITKFGDTLNETFGNVNGTNLTAFDRFSNSAQETLTNLGFDTSSVAPSVMNNAADLAGAAIGGATTITLNQALLDPLGQYDDILAQRYSPQQIQLLKNEARNALSQQAFDRITGETTNPFADTPEGLEEFNKVIAGGIERRNTDLGANITQQQFDQGFEGLTGEGILGQETDLRKQAFNRDLDQTFSGKAFDPVDDEIINSIVEERQGPARQQVGNFVARGNFNPIGGRSANEFLTNQEESARNRVRDVGSSVLGGTQQNINFVGDDARSAISGYKLGDDLFDATPFNEQRQGLIEGQQASLGEDIRGSLGSEPLFDINKALQSGGRVQGQVSGQGSNQGFLDALAARENSVSSGRNRRGVGSRGSGEF